MMAKKFTCHEMSGLFAMLAENTSDIILKTDFNGFIVQASPGITRLGVQEPAALVSPHILDIVAPEAKELVSRVHGRAVAGEDAGADWTEFPALTADGDTCWFEVRFQALRHDDGKVYGTIGMMRSTEDRRALSDQLFAATYSDPLTGLTNRGAFIAMLEHMLKGGMDGCIAMFSIDFFRTINMQHGQSVGDEVLTVFADLLREMLRSEDLISRIGSERFAVLLPHANPEQAQAVCRRVVSTLAELRQKVRQGKLTITASAGVARIAGTLDSTIERAEMALFVAKAKGRNRLEMEQPARNAAA